MGKIKTEIKPIQDQIDHQIEIVDFYQLYRKQERKGKIIKIFENLGIL